MTHHRRESPFWRSVGARLLAIMVLAWLSILWFRGCLAPQIQEEILRDQQNTHGSARPAQ
ncbi:hypothetical protein [Frigoriglobus tundricola]|uniref:Uncharacterized protein n=1 Tax=Frigoriglobus tundricola TaxID=2774151 RepID=A0A6M5YY96_9BACT|nr:hypothetical protein [Frigoriglobus tundricola]QJW98955.1 hypothetical protein FTUN_6550 [Frigoriglobus tundricola]